MSFQFHEGAGPVFLTASLLQGVRHGFSTRLGGVSPAPWDSLNLGPGRGDAPENVAENHRRFLSAIGADYRRCVLARQVHETTVRPVTAADAGKGLLRPRDYTADALVTNEPDLPLAVFSADCGTVLLWDPQARCVGAVHAGWRGCAAGIVEKTVRILCQRYGAAPETLVAALGPCIGPCCFETDEDVPRAMEAALGPWAAPCLERRGAKWHVDLAELNRRWLLRAGLAPERIEVCGLCTACRRDLFWSHRKMGEARGVQAAVIVL